MVRQVFIIFSSENQIQIFWGTNLPFKSDFESHFTFEKFSLKSPEMEGGEGSSDQSPDFWWKDLRARPSPDFTLCSPEIAKKGGV